MRKKIAVLASGSGTNAENIIRYFREKSSACVALVLTNRQNACVLERSRGLEVPCFYFPKSDWENGEAILSVLREHDIDFVVLAGFLARVPDRAMAPPCTLVNKPSSSNSAKSRRKVSSDTPSSELNAVM